MLKKTRFSEQKGAVGLTVAVGAAVLAAFAALTIDIGYGLVTRAELQNVADAAVLAGNRALGQLYEGMVLADQQVYVLSAGDRQQVIGVINEVAQKNRAGAESITISQADIQIGRWDTTNRSLTVTANQPTAVRIVARRDGAANGPIATFLGGTIGVDSLNVSAQATAALLPMTTVMPGELNFPVGISKKWFEGGTCGDTIKFYPTGTSEGCAGWHTFDQFPANANTLRNILDGLEEGEYTSPGLLIGQAAFAFTGGTVASAFDDIEDLYDAKKDPVTGEWKTFVVVYDQDDCSNPGGLITIVGFATVVITAVNTAPDKEIITGLACDAIETGRGGDATGFGTLGSIPALVS